MDTRDIAIEPDRPTTSAEDVREAEASAQGDGDPRPHAIPDLSDIVEGEPI